ncbi:MAG: hypothetical protein ACRCV9_00630 [Burkholderiaceae bacterium]
MSKLPSSPDFGFLVNHRDYSGTATWRVWVSRRKGWEPKVHTIEFDSFRAASRINDMLQAAFNAGVVAGRAELAEVIKRDLHTFAGVA